jgi:hypothetical protein
MYDQGSMDRIGRLMSLRDLVTAGQMAPDAAPLPMNTLRNNTTGAEYQFEPSPQGGAGRQSPQLDYSQPIEIFGQGKGYAIKGQPMAAMINGRRVDYGVDSAKSQALTQAAQDRAIKLAQAQQDFDSRALGNEKDRLELASLRSTGGAKPLTESQGKAAGFSLRAEDSDNILRGLGKEGGGTGTAAALREVPVVGGALGDLAEWGGDVLGVSDTPMPGSIKRAAEAVPFVGEGLGTLTNWTQSEPQQKVEQAQRNFINAVLRRESGAVISPEEFDNARKQYFPQPGDEQGTVAQKQENRQATIAALKTESGQGYEQARAKFEARKAVINGNKNPRESAGSKTVVLPDGQVMTFPSAAHADGFRQAAGL